MKALLQAAKRKCQTKTLINIFWLLSDRILRMSVSLYVGVLVTRYLGISRFGLLSFATAWVSLFYPITTLGIPNLVVRDVASDAKNKEKILGTAFWLQLIGGALSLVLSIVAILFSNQQNEATLGLVAILSCVGLFQSFGTIDLWFQSQVASKHAVIARNTAFLIASLIKILLVVSKASIFAFAVASLIESILSALFLILAYRIQGHSLRLWEWNPTLARGLVYEGWPLILNGLATMLYLRIDQIMLGEMTNTQSVGLYSVAVKVSELWYFFPTAIASSIAPSIYAYAKQKDEDGYYRRLSQLLRVLALVSVAIALPMTFASRHVVVLLFGHSYAAAGTILSIHIWAALFIFSGVGASSWFVAENLLHLSFHRTVLGAIVNITLNLFLIPAYSGTGAAIATVISYAIASVFANAIDKRTRKMFYLQIRSLFLIP